MSEDRIAMSQRERDRLKVMAEVLQGQRTQVEAARLLGRSTRQVRRIQRRLEAEGDGAVIHKLRGRPSNRRLDGDLRRKVVELYRSDYPDFGPTFAAEKLTERGLKVAVRTLRQWLVEAGLWQRQRKRDKHRQRRERRACFGELVQADGSHHDWLEGRGPWLVLLVMIDDATSRATARFYPAETTEGYMHLLWRYLGKHGRMKAMYVDRDSIFRAETQHPDDPRPVLTQFKRALEELDIDLILAGSPQAKGRVERFNKTAQDRLVKELRLAGAGTMEEANAVLQEKFLPWFNRRCTVPASSPNDAHRGLHQSMNLAAILSHQQSRKVTNDYTIRLENRIYQILPPALPGLRGGRVIIEQRLDGSRHLRFKGQYLKHTQLEPAPGALPPDPRSLALSRTPAESGAGAEADQPAQPVTAAEKAAIVRKGRAAAAWRCRADKVQGRPAGTEKKAGQAAATAQPSAVRPANGRSGRTPAEPCPARGQKTLPQQQPRRPAPDHPWRRGHF